ncbi:alpha-protein kinase 1 [Drosophila ficusphila]|uniref:alpha-protein kinase 1 n=1 Tax=Drosophila ficusphila TaxID=30025 RepID=UPI0007E624BD|nr:alpha-protein kinase 1 [Drosophila ficusphila]
MSMQSAVEDSQGQQQQQRETRTRLDPGSTKGRRWIMGLILGYTIMSLVVVKVASASALYQQQHLQQQHLHQQHLQQQQQQSPNDIESSADEPSTSEPGHSDSDVDIEKMRAKLQQLQHEQQQQYLLQQQHQLQLHLQQMQASQGVGGENAYLLERADSNVAPIYGTWRAKAQRQQHATPSHESGDAAHLYERLPKRSVTMTPQRGLPRDQMPRPPRLTTQDMQLSLGSPSPPPAPTKALLRRQYSETPGSRAQRGQEEFKPKPFHFPYDGPMPEQFTKGEARPELNNIQDILQHLHIGGGAPSKLPPMVMMPTGLHIAGSFKNLKSSGIGNFFRGKRHKKQMQFSIPMPMFPMAAMPMPMPMSMPMQMPMQWYSHGVLPHQRVAIDQLYPYKPRSPQDVNLLAMQPLVSGKPLSKKKKKKQQQQLQQQLQQQQQQQQQQLLEHGSQQQHFVADPFVQHFPHALNATRQPQLKRVPFKVNLDIYPVLPPSRPSSVMRHPFQQEFALPSPAALTGTTAAAFHMGHGIYQSPFKFPTQQPVLFPDQATRFSQQQQAFHKFPPPKSVHPEESIYGQSPGQSQGPVESQTSPIMLHLNVFPKQKPTATIRASTNPFYNHNMQRNTVNSNDLPPPNPPSPIEPRHAAGNATQLQQHQVNQTQQQHQLGQQQHQLGQQQHQLVQQQHQLVQQQHQLAQQQHLHATPGNRSSTISRSDHLPLIDFEHPIVAAELPDSAPLTRQDHRYRQTPVDEPYRYPKSANIEQLAAEAQTASLFRFPVEDLIQFQVDDAL